MSASPRVVLLCLATLLFWGVWAFFGRIALLKRMPPTSLLLAEASISCLCAVVLTTVLLASGRENVLSLRSWNVFGLVSGAALAFGLLTYYFALEHGNISIVTPVTAAYPVVSVALAFAVLGERPSLSQWCGIVLVISGTALLFTNVSPSAGGDSSQPQGPGPANSLQSEPR